MYYKATRPDGTSFADGETRWVVGEVTSLAEDERRTTLCKAGVLHASKEPGESLVGGSWPCRLFEVEPLGKVITSPGHPHKVGAHEWSVIRELPAWMALGPNGEAVADLIESVRRLTADKIRGLDAARDAGYAAWAAREAALDAAWDAARDAAREAARDAAREAAWDAAWDAAREAALDAAWEAARDAAREAAWDAAWAAREAAWDAAWDAARDAARDAAWDAAWDAARDAARDAAWVAAIALLVRDLITPEQFDLLYGPWASVMEGE